VDIVLDVIAIFFGIGLMLEACHAVPLALGRVAVGSHAACSL